MQKAFRGKSSLNLNFWNGKHLEQKYAFYVSFMSKQCNVTSKIAQFCN